MEPIEKIILYKERHGTPRQSELQSKPSNYEPVEATMLSFPTKYPLSRSKIWKDLTVFG